MSHCPLALVSFSLASRRAQAQLYMGLTRVLRPPVQRCAILLYRSRSRDRPILAVLCTTGKLLLAVGMWDALHRCQETPMRACVSLLSRPLCGCLPTSVPFPAGAL